MNLSDSDMRIRFWTMVFENVRVTGHSECCPDSKLKIEKNSLFTTLSVPGSDHNL